VPKKGAQPKTALQMAREEADKLLQEARKLDMARASLVQILCTLLHSTQVGPVTLTAEEFAAARDACGFSVDIKWAKSKTVKDGMDLTMTLLEAAPEENEPGASPEVDTGPDRP
jgi:hypothetical protein